jgi:hypothetical protein
MLRSKAGTLGDIVIDAENRGPAFVLDVGGSDVQQHLAAIRPILHRLELVVCRCCQRFAHVALMTGIVLHDRLDGRPDKGLTRQSIDVAGTIVDG